MPFRHQAAHQQQQQPQQVGCRSPSGAHDQPAAPASLAHGPGRLGQTDPLHPAAHTSRPGPPTHPTGRSGAKERTAITAQRKKNENKNSPPGPTRQPLTLLLLSVLRRGTQASSPAAILGPRASNPRAPCPTVPPLIASRPRPDPRSRQTLTLAFPSSIAAAPKPCRRRSPPRFSCSGELWLNPSLGELLLALLLRFRRSHGLNRLPAGPPPLSSARRRPCPSHRPLVAAPRLRHRR